MRFQLTTIVAVLAVSGAFADAPKPNTLTAKEIADGWILLFDGETTFGLKSNGDVAVESGTVKVGGKHDSAIETKATFLNFRLRFEVQLEKPEQLKLVWGKLRPNFVPLLSSAGWSAVEYTAETTNGTTIVTWEGLDPPAKKHSIEETRLMEPSTLGWTVSAGNQVKLRNIKLKPLGMASLFNGKDLSGWKQYTGDPGRMKSKFTVTPEGWINVQNGSGDLQSEVQCADFVFQGECICNGKHLNSGVFFRCLPGQYLQGYEMQILNKWQGDDRNKPIDFGTGAIYRRQRARRVVSTDREWFAFTIAAHGRHMATWIDGFPVCEWTDPRPAKDNAREGAKLGKGHFSIQGHDPTTNLSFRNLRVAELK